MVPTTKIGLQGQELQDQQVSPHGISYMRRDGTSFRFLFLLSYDHLFVSLKGNTLFISFFFYTYCNRDIVAQSFKINGNFIFVMSFAVSSSLLVLLSTQGCKILREEITGMRESNYLVYDDIIGRLSDQENGLVFFLGEGCGESFDATSALEGMGVAPFFNKIRREDIQHIDVYARWDDSMSTYNLDSAWLVLNCPYFSTFAAWLIVENYGNASDSFSLVECEYFDRYDPICVDEEKPLRECNQSRYY